MKTKVHYYKFDTSDHDEARAYDEMCEDLKGKGLKVFATWSTEPWGWYQRVIKPLDGKQVTLETKHIFDNQWNSAPTQTSEKGLRLFDWAEAIYYNKNIKEGYHLGITPAMKKIRKTTLKCGYCGKNYPNGKGKWCEACIDSPYLKEDQIYLLRLKPAGLPFSDTRSEREPLTRTERDNILPTYITQQTTAKGSRAVQRLKDTRAGIEKKYEKNIKANDHEYHGFIWLMDEQINIENCIYYAHTDQFCFGWRTKLSPEAARVLRDSLWNFPYMFTIKGEKS